jgi:hypothetical protein
MRLKATMLSKGFKVSTSDHSLYVMHLPDGQQIWCNTYEDDLFLAANPGPVKDKILSQLEEAFEIKDLGIMCMPLGMEQEYDHEMGTGLHPSSSCTHQGSTQ